MSELTDGIRALHNAFRHDVEIIDATALASAQGEGGLEATIERFRFLNEVLEWHAAGEDAFISPLVEAVAPSVYETYERDHRELDTVFLDLRQAVSLRDPLSTARATKVFKFHLDLHLDKEEAHMYRLISDRVPLADQAQALGQMGAHMPPERFPEFVAWMFPLVSTEDRVNMVRGWGMPPEAFKGPAKLIEQAIGDEWAELARNIPELIGA